MRISQPARLLLLSVIAVAAILVVGTSFNDAAQITDLARKDIPDAPADFSQMGGYSYGGKEE